jgi:hypothetical protein
MPSSSYELVQPESSVVKLPAWISKYPDKYPSVVVLAKSYGGYRTVKALREGECYHTLFLGSKFHANKMLHWWVLCVL